MGGNEIDNLLFNYFYPKIVQYSQDNNVQLKADKKMFQKIKNSLVTNKCKLSASGASEVYI